MANNPNQLVEHFFRHESANLISVLTRVFGFAHLQRVEDTVQAALIEALEHWKINGVPDNPASWIHRVAKNKILDSLRREKTEARIFERLAESTPLAGQALAAGFESMFEPAAIDDSLLRMMFACCHPSLDRHSQIAVTLRILCGFSVNEVASALLLNEEAARKRIYRAKKTMAGLNVGLEFPAPEELKSRVGAVIEVLYLMFNEGYHATTGDLAIREDVCEEAARLCHLLCQKPEVGGPSSQALLALMLFHAARFNARIDDDGALVLLEDQDRSKWDNRLIGFAEYWLEKSKSEEVTTFHLEAAIAQVHCRATSFDETQWNRIVDLYDHLVAAHPTPVYILNRAVARGASGDLPTAINELKDISEDPRLAGYFLLDCSLAHLYRMSGAFEPARKHLLRAKELAKSKPEIDLIQTQLAELGISGQGE